MDRPRFMRHLYSRWLFLSIGLAGLGNLILLTYRFAVLGLLSHAAEHIAAAVFSLVTCVLALAIFVDLTLRKPSGHE
jgi:tellurite resistance protein TehA-like permease